jgi:hypothetical protein
VDNFFGRAIVPPHLKIVRFKLCHELNGEQSASEQAGSARDAPDSLAVVELVLDQTTISSPLIDNLNASLYLRALLTDLFLIDEILKARNQENPASAAGSSHWKKLVPRAGRGQPCDLEKPAVCYLLGGQGQLNA